MVCGGDRNQSSLARAKRWCGHCSVAPTYHETLLDAKVVVDDFGQGGQAVGGAGGVAVETRANTVFHQTRSQKPPQAGYGGLKLGKGEWMGLCVLPDNGHAGGVIFVLVNTHDKHWSVG